jgi:hypothetical protein
MKNNLFNDLTETQSEAINGGFLDATALSAAFTSADVTQTSGAALVGVVFGNATVTSYNTSDVVVEGYSTVDQF